MNYELTDYQGNKIIVPDTKAGKIAEVAGLMEIEVNGLKHYVNPSNIASIKPAPAADRYKTSAQLGMPDLSIV